MSKIKRMSYKILCKIGLHNYRVWGHCDVRDEKDHDYSTEYYYKCVRCDASFWDYEIKKAVYDWVIDTKKYEEMIKIDE